MPANIAQDIGGRPSAALLSETYIGYAIRQLRGFKLLLSYVRRTTKLIAAAKDELCRPHSLRLSIYSTAVLSTGLDSHASWHHAYH